MSSKHPPVVFDYETAETALCIHEWMLENRDTPLLKPLFENCGSVAMRLFSLTLAPIVNQAYADFQTFTFLDYSGSYDWDFVPAFCSTLPWSTFEMAIFNNQTPSLAEDVIKACLVKARPAMDQFVTILDPFDDWKNSVKNLSIATFAINILDETGTSETDLPDWNTWSPSEYVEHFGEKYHLATL